MGVDYVESARAVPGEESTIDRWKRTLRERRPPVRMARGIAISGALIAVLFAGRSTAAPRLIDFQPHVKS
jgi:hypothetical protein